MPNNGQQALNAWVAQIGVPLPIAYGYVRATGNNVILHELTNKTRVAFYLLAEGEWDGIIRLWVNKVQVNAADTTKVHFHPGLDAPIGFGLGAVSTGGDQKVDSFWNDLPAAMQRVTFNRKAYLALKIPHDPAYVNAELAVLGDYRTTKCRIFDNAGTQTNYAFTTNSAWHIMDLILRSSIKRQGLINAALSAGEKAMFDFPSFKDTADYFDAIITGTTKRWEGSYAFPHTTNLTSVIEQIMTICPAYLIEKAGKFYLQPEKSRAYSFTATSDHQAALALVLDKKNLRGAANRVFGEFNDLALPKTASVTSWSRTGNVLTITCAAGHPVYKGDTVEVVGTATGAGATTGDINGKAIGTTATTISFSQVAANDSSGVAQGYVGYHEGIFTARSRMVEHVQHQKTVGRRGKGLQFSRRVVDVTFPMGNNSAQQVDRAIKLLVRKDLGLDSTPYRAPWDIKLTVPYYAVDAADNVLLSLLPGDILKVDRTISEEYQGDYELLESNIQHPSASGDETQTASKIELYLREFVAGAFSDAIAGSDTLTLTRPPRGRRDKIVTLISEGNSATGTLTAGVYETGIQIFAPQRSYCVAVMDRLTHEWLSFKQYDVFGVGAVGGLTATNLATDLNALDDSVIVFIFTYDEPQTNRLTGGLPAAMKRCGASDSFTSPAFRYRSAYILCGIPGVGTGGGIEHYKGDSDSDVNAEMSVDIAIIDGKPVGVATGMSASRVLEAVNMGSTPTNAASARLTQSGTTTTINVAATTFNIGDYTISFNSGSVNPGAYGTYYVYVDDPTFAGGAVTFLASTSNPNVTGANGRFYYGKITTSGAGGGGGSGGGGGACFPAGTLVITKRGNIPIEEVGLRDEVLTAKGTWKRVIHLIRHKGYAGELHEMEYGERVTPEHEVKRDGKWTPAHELFPSIGVVEEPIDVFNLEVEAEDFEEHSYTLASGLVVHNVEK